MKKKEIIKAFKKNNLPLQKIKRAIRGDGWYIYHPQGTEWKTRKRKLIKEKDGMKTFETWNAKIYGDFLPDDCCNESLNMIIAEAKRRIPKYTL